MPNGEATSGLDVECSAFSECPPLALDAPKNQWFLQSKMALLFNEKTFRQTEGATLTDLVIRPPA
jgi:hypothetical protein